MQLEIYKKVILVDVCVYVFMKTEMLLYTYMLYVWEYHSTYTFI